MTPRERHTGKHCYTWNWVGGGYNSCRADTKAQARRKAKAFEAECSSCVIDWSTFRRVSDKEMASIDRYWASCFD